MAGPRTITSATAPPSIKQQKGQRPQEALPCATQQVTPTRPNKRRHTPFGSPSMARSETGSPRAKQQARMSPVATSPITISTVSCSASKPQQQTATSTTPSSSSSSSPRPSSRSRSVSVSPLSQLAVPKVSAEPPCPSELPKPPSHWTEGSTGEHQLQHCRLVTASLLSHLHNSGILVGAQ